jgi:hypothetical protein
MTIQPLGGNADATDPLDEAQVIDITAKADLPVAVTALTVGPVLRSDFAWFTAAAAYRQARRDLEAAEAAEVRAKEGLVALTQHSTEFGCGVTVLKSLSFTADDEVRALRLGVDLQRHFGKGCFGVRVRLDE